MSAAAINWFACWICMGVGVGFGMLIAGIFGRSR